MAMDLTLRLPVDLGPLGEQLQVLQKKLDLLLIRQRHEILRSIDQETNDLAAVLKKIQGSSPDEAAYLKTVTAKLEAMGKTDVSDLSSALKE